MMGEMGEGIWGRDRRGNKEESPCLAAGLRVKMKLCPEDAAMATFLLCLNRLCSMIGIEARKERW